METVAHYRILERLGESRLGETFRARDSRLGRSVALTIPRDDIQNDPQRRAQLLADAQTAIGVSHPNIAALYEVGDDAGRMYLAFEFVPGEPLERVIAGHPLNPRRAIDLAIQVADGLAEAHAADISHGGITPRTVVVTPKGNAKIVEFGFTRWLSGDAGKADEPDLDALRSILFEMFTGRPHATTSVAPTTLNKSLPAETDAIVSKAYDSAVVFAAELRALAAILETRAEAARTTRPTTIRGRSRRSKAPVIAVVLAIVLAAAIAAAWWWFR